MRWGLMDSRCLLLVLSALGSADLARCEAFTLERIVDTETSAPGRISDFVTLTDPAIEDDQIAFAGMAAGPGIWTHTGGELRLVAAADTPFLDDADGFFSFTSPTLAGGQLAFIGKTQRLQGEGVYLAQAEQLRRLIGVAEGPDAGFRAFNQVWIAPTGIAFRASWSEIEPGRSDLFDTLWAGTPGELAPWIDQNTELPGALGPVRNLDQIAFDSGAAFVIARRDSGQGVYRVRAEAIETVVDSTMNLPDRNGKFRRFRTLSARRETVAFIARGQDGTPGVYALKENRPVEIAASGIPIGPDEQPAFSFRTVAADRGQIAILAESRGTTEAVLLWKNGRLITIASTGDDLDGDIAQTFMLGPQGLSGNSLAFQVELENGEQALYRADLDPE